MQVPRFWAHVINPKDGKILWRSSPDSLEDAQRIADELRERLSKHASKRKLNTSRLKECGLDDYPRPVTSREMLLEEYYDAQGQTTAFLTRNLVGSLVMNYRNLLIFDWDLVPPTFSLFKFLGNGFTRLKSLLFGPKPSEPQEDSLQRQYPWLFHLDWEERLQHRYNQQNACRCTNFSKDHLPIHTLRPLAQYIEEHPNWSVRIYQTAGGYRGIATHAAFDPTNEETLDLMRKFQCDSRYIAFCKFQQSFRARISPKGWRCGFRYAKVEPGFRFRYPWLPNDTHTEEMYAQGVKIYEEKTRSFAVCRYLGTLGRERIHPEIQPFLELHDQRTLVPQSVFDSDSKAYLAKNDYLLA